MEKDSILRSVQTISSAFSMSMESLPESRIDISWNLLYPNVNLDFALEFDPSWKVPGSGDFSREHAKDHISNMLITPVRNFSNGLWLMDYRLRRSTHSPRPLRIDRRVFHGNGCRFIEVLWQDEGDWGHFERDDGSLLKYNSPNVFDFVEDLGFKCLEHELDIKYGFRGWDPETLSETSARRNCGRNAGVGVLACELLG